MRTADLSRFELSQIFEFLAVRQGAFRYVFSLVDQKANHWMCIVWAKGKAYPIYCDILHANDDPKGVLRNL